MINSTDENQQLLSLAFPPGENPGLRVSQADLARLLGISSARVSQLVKTGKITVYSDGKIDPDRASREILKNCNPAKLRIKPFRSLRTELDELRDTAKQLRSQVRDHKQQISDLERQLQLQAQQHDQQLQEQLRQLQEQRQQLVHAAGLFGLTAAWFDAFYAEIDQLPLDTRSVPAEAWSAVVDQAYDAAAEAADAMHPQDALQRTGEDELFALVYPPAPEPSAETQPEEEQQHAGDEFDLAAIDGFELARIGA
jgi:TolA-binding protein